MDPLEIKIELMRARVKQVDIARKANVTETHVGRVIGGKSTSDRVQRLIAKAIGKPVSMVFPERYGRKKVSAPGLERLAG